MPSPPVQNCRGRVPRPQWYIHIVEKDDDDDDDDVDDVDKRVYL